MTVSCPRATAIIVTYRSRETIRSALQVHREANEAGMVRVIVVDNASDDGTADIIADEFPWVELIRSKTNLGYGRGCNLGARDVETEYVLIMNPDATLAANELQTLVQFMDDTPQAGIAAPAIRESGSHLQAAGLMTTPGILWREALGRAQPHPEYRPIVPGAAAFRTEWVCGAIMLIRSALFRSLGGFDPRFFLYFEETDLCRRVTNAGSEIWAVGEAVGDHVGGASMEEADRAAQRSYIPEHYFRSRFYYLVKHFGWMRAISAEVAVRSSRQLRILGKRLVGRRPVAPARNVSESRPFLKFPAHPSDAT